MEDVARRPPSYLKILFLVAGGRGTEATVLLWFPYFNNDAKNNEAEYLKVGPGSPCPVLQHPKNVFKHPKICSHREDGARRPRSYFKLPFLVAGGRGTETTVLLGNKQPHPHPLPVEEGSEYPCFLLEDGARRPSSYLDNSWLIHG